MRRPRRSRPSPGTWSRRVLASLSEHQMQGREVASLEMLLTSIIQLDPPREAFSDLLAQYVDGSRAGDRRGGAPAAAGLVARPPRHGGPASPAPGAAAHPGWTAGRVRVEIACLTVNTDSAHLQTYGPLQQRSLAPRALEQEVAIRRARRGRVPPGTPTAPHGYEHLLRAIGAALDGEPAETYDIVVTPRVVVVGSASTGQYHLFTTEQLDALLRAAPHAREFERPGSARGGRGLLRRTPPRAADAPVERAAASWDGRPCLRSLRPRPQATHSARECRSACGLVTPSPSRR